MFDPIGPGTTAWNAFDKAIIAWRNAGPQPNWGERKQWRTSRAVKSYYNWRMYMAKLVKKHGGNVEEWFKSLDEMKNDPDYEI